MLGLIFARDAAAAFPTNGKKRQRNVGSNMLQAKIILTILYSQKG